MQIFNTLTRKKEPFVPVREGKVGIYACGPTVYNYFHIGNARPFILFDTLRRFLKHIGYDVTFVQNFTDIDDRMIKSANEQGTTVDAIAEKYIAEYFKDAQALGVLEADVHPRATKHIGEIIAIIKKLEAKGLAYAVDGDVYFDTQAYRANYGKLIGQNLDDLESGARVEVGEVKRHPMDFALWKAQKPGEPFWKSPWGEGRPGWHIECSAMSMKYLGDTFDIHCGGVDLIFPHHENEIAQSEGATGKPFAKYWMHNGHINVDNKKMSKSEGNFFMVRDILKEYDAEAVRLFMLSAHYRSPINFSRELIEQATSSLERLYTARNTALFNREHAPERAMNADEQTFAERAKKAVEAFDAAMSDDLNTADALAAIFEHVRDMNSSLTADSAREAIDAGLNALGTMTDVLGLLRKDFDATPDEVKALVEQRVAAKKAKDFALADQIRQEVLDMGYIIEDTPKGPMVKKA
ncbi:MAG: cysteine--tRNA ligase [Clostridiales bacterium]|jgi:cysteinyl-tRNA synthetase|nr:cysteine--tRNA ligase [Clostridiales bacterium]